MLAIYFFSCRPAVVAARSRFRGNEHMASDMPEDRNERSLSKLKGVVFLGIPNRDEVKGDLQRQDKPEGSAEARGWRRLTGIRARVGHLNYRSNQTALFTFSRILNNEYFWNTVHSQK